jgi:hypothetical protein
MDIKQMLEKARAEYHVYQQANLFNSEFYSFEKWVCLKYHCQMCDTCDCFTCCDCTNPAKPRIK